MAIAFSFNVHALGLVRDRSEQKLLGTAFSFIRPQWYVTAKHVVVEYGQTRDQISLFLDGHSDIPARVLFLHPELDLAVLEVSKPVCDQPLFPGHHQFSGAQGLVAAGYAPSKKLHNGGPVVQVSQIESFEVQVRGRASVQEETIVFDAPESEGGNSGGPIFGAGGGVVGAIIENFRSGESLLARGTSIIPLTRHLSFS